MKDYLEIIKNIPNIFGILFSGILILFCFPDEVRNYRFYILAFLIITLFIAIIRYLSTLSNIANIYKDCSLIELLLIEKCRQSKLQTYKINNESVIFDPILSLTFKNIFFKPSKQLIETDLFVMFNDVFELINSRFLVVSLKRAIKDKSHNDFRKVLPHLSDALVDFKFKEFDIEPIKNDTDSKLTL